MALTINPPDGSVRVVALLLMDDEAVRLAARSRILWIKRQRVHFQEQAHHSNAREYEN
jgi:hypothetical protein